MLYLLLFLTLATHIYLSFVSDATIVHDLFPFSFADIEQHIGIGLVLVVLFDELATRVFVVRVTVVDLTEARNVSASALR